MDERNVIILCALLHDIGKFWERTNDINSLDDEYRKKLQSADYRHVHWSANFIHRFSFLFSNPQSVEKLVENHHSPISRDEWIIHVADRLSAMERDKEIVKKDKSEVPLFSIFSEIKLNNSQVSLPLYAYSLNKLEIKRESLFPKEKVEISSNKYRSLWEEFEKEIKCIKNKDDIFTIYYIIKKYTTFITSSAAEEKPDISLFDHIKTTSAIAISLYIDNVNEEYLKMLDKGLTNIKKTISKEEEVILNNPRFILIGGDVCGIQKFIYSLTFKGTAKGLRGRSFYIELLSEVISKYILKKLDLPITNLLYCDGGRFYILAPLTVENKLNEIYKEINKKLLSMHSGSLSIVINWIKLSTKDFAIENIGSKWDELNKELMNEKKHKFGNILDENYEDIFNVLDKGGESIFCEICGSEKVVEEKDGIFKCESCIKFEEIAKPLGRAQFFIETYDEKQIKNIPNFQFNEFGFNYYFIETINDLNMLLNVLKAEQINVYSINTTNFLIPNIKNGHFGFRFSALHTPFKDDDIKTFEDFANESIGIHHWSVLRMDVDNLGKIFSKGLGDRSSISRLSTLSLLFSLFFHCWINERAKKYGNLYVIYSGGDDLFIVGSWNIIPEFASEINKDFCEFTCNNPNITISGGIYLSPGIKFPLYIAAKNSGDALEKSKGLEDKNAITFLDTPVKWSDFDKEKEICAELYDVLENKGVSRSLLYALLENVYTQYELYKNGKIPIWRVWNFFYIIKRFMEKHSEAQDKLLDLEKKFMPWVKGSPQEYGKCAIRWAEFLTRKEVR